MIYSIVQDISVGLDISLLPACHKAVSLVLLMSSWALWWTLKLLPSIRNLLVDVLVPSILLFVQSRNFIVIIVWDGRNKLEELKRFCFGTRCGWEWNSIQFWWDFEIVVGDSFYFLLSFFFEDQVSDSLLFLLFKKQNYLILILYLSYN